MERAWISLIVLVVAAALFGAIVPRAAAASGRPRFVIGLLIGALGVCICELWRATGAPPHERLVVGLRLSGEAARAVALIHAAAYATAAWGLWRLRAWGRLFAMGVLAYLVVSFLLWGLRGGDEDVISVMLWQMFVLPCLVFGFMYLERGSRFFPSHRARPRPD